MKLLRLHWLWPINTGACAGAGGRQAAGRGAQERFEDTWSHSTADTWRHSYGVPPLPGPPLTLHQMREGRYLERTMGIYHIIYAVRIDLNYI